MQRVSAVLLTPILLSSLLLCACDNTEQLAEQTLPEQARPAKIMPVLVDGVEVLRNFPGTLEAASRVELSFRVGGQLSQLPAKAGLEFKKGELLAALDEDEYKNTVNQHKARYDLALIQYDQAKKLLKQKLASQIQFDQAEAELKSAKASLDQAKDNLKYTHLRAPFDGAVARVDIKNFQTVQAKSPIIRFQDVNLMDIRFSIPESLITQFRQIEDPKEVEGICGSISFSSHPGQRYKACHKEHESLPDDLTRNYAAVFSLDERPDFSILPGMSVLIELDFSSFLPKDREIRLLVPVEAVFEKNNKRWVWRVDNESRARKTAVETGVIKNGQLEVTQGVKPADRVITAGVSYVREGMLVKPLVKERGL